MPEWGFNKPDEAEQGGSPLPDDISEEWVERHIVPRLQSLSRRGVVVAYDSGIEPQSKAAELEEAPEIVSSGANTEVELAVGTANDVTSFDVPRGVSQSGIIHFAMRTATAPHLQCAVGSLYFVMGVQTSGRIFFSPGTALTMPDREVVGASTGTLTSRWAFLITASDQNASVKFVLRATPLTSLAVGTANLSYSQRLY